MTGIHLHFRLIIFMNRRSEKIYFHGAKAGHKVDALKKDDKVCLQSMEMKLHEEGDWATVSAECGYIWQMPSD